MPADVDALKWFIERLKSLNFFQRLFHWKEVRNGLIDVAASISSLNSQLTILQSERNNLQVQLAGIAENNRNLITSNNHYQLELAALKEKLVSLERDCRLAKEEAIILRQEDEFRRTEYSNAMATLQSIKEGILQERKEELEERTRVEMERLRRLKETWFQHQTGVKNRIKAICNKHTIEYMEKAPFEGEPDNTLKICDEYIVFDAKSPAGDDLNNFPSYLKDQAEKAKKYARQEGVKRDIFFVVPATTLEVVSQHCYGLGDFNIFIVSFDSLEPVIVGLKKLEEYEFAKQLSPEERENICRILGKFAHLAKRRIQIDSFFARQFIEMAYRCENNLPSDISDKVLEFEKSEKLNPPLEKRTKAINTKELEKDTLKLGAEAESKGILLENFLLAAALNSLPLYKSE